MSSKRSLFLNNFFLKLISFALALVLFLLVRFGENEDNVIEKDVPIEVTLQGQVAKGFRVVRTVAEPQTIEISGPHPMVLPLTKVETMPIDISGAKTSLVAQVELMALPNRLKSPAPLEIKVKVMIEPVASN